MTKTKRQPKQGSIPILFPSFGVDDNAPFDLQRPGTSARIQNCRPFDASTGRRRGARRPGLSRYLNDYVEQDKAIQDIIAAPLPRGAAVGTGNVLTVGVASDKVLIFDADGGNGTTAGASLIVAAAAMDTANTIGKYDEDNNAYVAADDCSANGVVNVRSYNNDFVIGTTTVERWDNILVAPGTTYRLCGLAANGGVVYVYVAGTAVSAIYRLNSVTGALLDSGAWMTHTDGIPVVSLGAGSRNMLVAGSGLLGVLGTVGANPLVLRQIDISTKTVAFTNALSVGYGPFNGFLQHMNMCMDAGANFYVTILTSDDGVTNFHSRTHRVHWDGTITWTKTDSASPSSSIKGEYDLTYDETGSRLVLVGTALNGTTRSLHTRDPLTGDIATGSQPYTRTTWARIASDGLGGFRLRRAAANTDVAKINSSLTEVWQYDSGVNTTGWIASTNAAPAALSVTGTLRSIRLLTVVNGNLYRVDSGYPDLIKSGFLQAASSGTAFSPAVTTFSTVFNFGVFYTDGFSYAVYNYANNVTTDLDEVIAADSTFSANPAPADANGRKCRLCETWGGRLVFAGLLSDPAKWFMSAIGDARNWNYGADASPDIAASQTNALALQPADIIQGMVPCGDQILLFLCQGSIWRLSGNPMEGGILSQVSDVVGGAFGRAWCKDPQGNVYFFGTDKGVYRMAPDGVPQRISTAVDASRLSLINLNTHQVRMVWDDRWRGVYILVTPYDATAATTNYWWDSDTHARATFQIIKTPGSWWPDVFANKNHNPLAVYAFDGDDATGRQLLVGTRDGRILKYDNSAESDDGTAIASEVLIGPIHDDEGNQFMLTDLHATLGSESSDVTWEIYTGESVESAFLSAKVDTGTFTAGRNHSQAIRVTGNALFVKLKSSAKKPIWSVDAMRGEISVGQGIVQRRQF